MFTPILPCICDAVIYLIISFFRIVITKTEFDIYAHLAIQSVSNLLCYWQDMANKTAKGAIFSSVLACLTFTVAGHLKGNGPVKRIGTL